MALYNYKYKISEEERLLAIAQKMFQEGGSFFYDYVRIKTDAEYIGSNFDQALIENLQNENILQEFIAKAQFLQHSMGIDYNTALNFASDAGARSFNKEISQTMFDEFMHFTVQNEKNPDILNHLVKQWVNDERSLEEKDFNDLTPLNITILHNNIEAFKTLLENGVNITQLDNDGFTPLHRIIAKIDNKSMDISVLEKWIENGLPTDAVDSRGNTALYYAKIFELSDAVSILESSNEIETQIPIISEVETKLDQTDIKDQKLLDVILNGNLNLLKNINESTEIELEVNGYTMKKKIYEALRILFSKDYIDISRLNAVLEHIPSDLKYTRDAALAFYQALIAQEEKFINILLINEFDVNYQFQHPTMPEKVTIMKLALGEIIRDVEKVKNNISVDNLRNIIDTRLKVIESLKTIGAVPDEVENARLTYLSVYDLDAIVENAPNEVNKSYIIANIEIAKSDLATAYVKCNLLVLKYLVNIDPYLDITITDKRTGALSSKKVHIIDLIRLSAHANIKYLNKDDCIIKEIIVDLGTSEAVSESLLYGLINKQEEFVKTMIKHNVDINYNDGEILGVLVGAGAGYIEAIKMAINNGAQITDKIKELPNYNSLSQIMEVSVNEYIEKQKNESIIKSIEVAKKPLNVTEKMKLLLILIKKGATDEEIKLEFGKQGDHYTNLAHRFKENPKALEAKYKQHKIEDVKVLDLVEDAAPLAIDDAVEALGNLEIEAS